MQTGITAEENLQHVQQLLMQNILHGCFWDQNRRRGPGLIAESSPQRSAQGHSEPETLNTSHSSFVACSLSKPLRPLAPAQGYRSEARGPSWPCPELGYTCGGCGLKESSSH